jgi:hypothetical protein
MKYGRGRGKRRMRKESNEERNMKTGKRLWK